MENLRLRLQSEAFGYGQYNLWKSVYAMTMTPTVINVIWNIQVHPLTVHPGAKPVCLASADAELGQD